MLFATKEKLDIIICPSCKGTSFLSAKKCPNCHGSAAGVNLRGKWLFWSYPLNRFQLALLRYRQVFNKIRKITVFALGLTTLIWFGFFLYQQNITLDFLKNPVDNFLLLAKKAQLLFWLIIIFFSYLWYRTVVEKKIRGSVELHDFQTAGAMPVSLDIQSCEQGSKLSHRKKIDISHVFTDTALQAVSRAYDLADKEGYKTMEPEHLFSVLLEFNAVGNIFIRLGVSEKTLQEKVSPIIRAKAEAGADAMRMPGISMNFWQVIFQAYEEAYMSHGEYVSITELLVATVKYSPEIQELLYDFSIDHDKLANVVEWARTGERLYRRYVSRAKAGSHRSKHGMDKAMTALATPYLNSFGEDLTRLAAAGRVEFCVARNQEMDEIFRIVSGSKQNVILTGDFGVGRRSIVEGIAERMITEDVPERMKDKRLVRLSVSSLLSGTTPSGAIERLIKIMREVAQARNVVLFIHNLHELIGVTTGGEGGSLDVAGALAEYSSNGDILIIATTTPDNYSRYLASSNLANIFIKIDITEMNNNQAIQVVEAKVGTIEYQNKVFFSYNAIARAVELSAQYLHEVYLPGSALDVVKEAATFTKNKKGTNTLVTEEEVAQVVAEKTGIPMTTVNADESTKLLNLEEEMHKRVVGQDEAVDLVANALRRARAQVRSEKRPIANFMFLGPTGVGKTELAKTIAEVYFGGEEKMIRIDMSEYQDKTSIYRLIGAPGEKGSGILTEAIRRQPFSLLLLDEIEKADADILNLFLQVMDDGRLTDSSGRVVDFTSVILIATSNARTAYVAEQLKTGLSTDIIKDRLLRGELSEYFRPEFLNRFDGIVLFKPLNMVDVEQIARLLFARLVAEMDEKGIELSISDEGLSYLATAGFDPEFGARPLRRVIQEKVENKLAELVLSGHIKRRDKISIGTNGEFKIIEKL